MTKHLIGIGLYIIALCFMIYQLITGKHMELKHLILYSISTILLSFVASGLLTGCATTKIVKVPVPVACPKPIIPAPPHNYMAALTMNSTAPDFVRACLATQESYSTAYEDCTRKLEVYK